MNERNVPCRDSIPGKRNDSGETVIGPELLQVQ